MEPTRTAVRSCSMDGCDRPHLARGLCRLHYKRQEAHGDPSWTPPVPTERCSIDGCDRPHKGRGWCGNHYRQWLLHGDPLVRVKPGRAPGPGHHKHLGDDIGYEAAHSRVHRLHGSAKTHSCANCGERAYDWAYDHEDPAERLDDARRMYYSPRPEHYRPLCRVCHQADDRAHRQQRSA